MRSYEMTFRRKHKLFQERHPLWIFQYIFANKTLTFENIIPEAGIAFNE